MNIACHVNSYVSCSVSDINTAAVAKDALEGHCIYDGGYCKLHISYSRHTDLNVKVYKSLFYKINARCKNCRGIN